MKTISDYYPIGTLVTFHPIIFEYDDQHERVVKHVQDTQIGRIVGLKDVPVGKYIFGGLLEDGDYEPSYLQVSGTMRVYRVRTCMLGAEKLALTFETKKITGDYVTRMKGRMIDEPNKH